MQDFIEPSHIQLLNMSRAYVLSRSLHTVAKLGLANYMDEPQSIETLAQATDTKPELLERLLKFLCTWQVFSYDENKFALTALSKPLRDDDPHSVRDVLCMVDESWWQAFSQMETNIKTGQAAFVHQHNDDFFAFLEKHEEKQNRFDKGMAKLSVYDDMAISKAFDFNTFSSLVDMGGGRGGLAKAIAELYSTPDICLFDTPAVIKQLEPHHFPAKISLMAGDFLKTIPKAQAYIFKGVLHDFNDEIMHKILHNGSQQMPSEARLFIAEQVMPDNDLPHPNKTMDIVMMILLGGRQRTLSEWQKSIEPSGFIFQNSYKTDSIFTLMEFKPVT